MSINSSAYVKLFLMVLFLIGLLASVALLAMHPCWMHIALCAGLSYLFGSEAVDISRW